MELHLKIDPATEDVTTAVALVNDMEAEALAEIPDFEKIKSLAQSIRYRLKRMITVTVD
jgi:hypothetical protein